MTTKRIVLPISTKIWLILGMLICAYFLSMTVGFYLGRRTESRLVNVSEYLFPAYRLSQSAVFAFKEQVGLYENAVINGDVSLIQMALPKAEMTEKKLKALGVLRHRDVKLRASTRHLEKNLSQFNKSAHHTYTLIAELLTNEELGAESNLPISRASLFEKAILLNKQSGAIMVELESFSTRFANALKMELAEISSVSRHQRYISALLFSIAVAFTLVLISILIERSINRPLKKTFMLERAVEQSMDGIVALDLDGTILFANHSWAKMLGYETETITGKNMTDLFPGTRYDQALKQFNSKAIQKGYHRGEVAHPRKNGSVFPALQTTTILKETQNDTSTIFHIIRDITERKQMEEALKKANQELADLASIDPLTGIANRRIFDQRLQNEWRRMCRDQTPLSVILCDIDHFKKYNDHFGHQAGDDCLRRVAAAISDSVRRPADIAARYGGEEFAAILPCTGADGAENVAERMLAAARDLNIYHPGSPPHAVITISVGAACILPAAGLSPEYLIHAADKALYDAKKNGRNRLHVRNLHNHAPSMKKTPSAS